ncbi:MAG TPA: hypothetical protein VF618_13100 [Thermoanaerobaculia bacterium]
MKRPLALLLVLLVFVTCKRELPVQDEVTLDFEEDGSIALTAQTSFGSDSNDKALQARAEAGRQSALAGTDAWSARFNRIDPKDERLTWDRRRGELQRVTRSTVIQFDDLQQFFADTPLMFQLLRRDGYNELTIYPGTSTRATRDQNDHFRRALADWSKAVQRYFVAVDHMYDYLEEQPQRAEFVFAALLDEKDAAGAPVQVTEKELALVEGVGNSMGDIADRLDAVDGYPLSEEADLIYNPFPAKLTIRVEGDISAAEGFDKKSEREVVVPQIELLDAVTRLEGRWITPDPLAVVMRDNVTRAADLARLPRRSTDVMFSDEIEKALVDQFKRPSRYVLRWKD